MKSRAAHHVAALNWVPQRQAAAARQEPHRTPPRQTVLYSRRALSVKQPCRGVPQPPSPRRPLPNPIQASAIHARPHQAKPHHQARPALTPLIAPPFPSPHPGTAAWLSCHAKPPLRTPPSRSPGSVQSSRLGLPVGHFVPPRSPGPPAGSRTGSGTTARPAAKRSPPSPAVRQTPAPT